MPASLDQRFVDNTLRLQQLAGNEARAQLIGAASSWFSPAPADGWLGNLHSAFQVASAFERTDLDKQYVDFVAPAEPSAVGSEASVLAVKVQGDILAQLERAYRSRHATPIKCAAHAGARHFGHGESGGVFSLFLDHINHLISEEI